MSLSDTSSHVPPMTGTYHYNNFQPGAGGHPSVGQAYLDPIFGEHIRRLTAVTGVASEEQYYGIRGYLNADATKCFSWTNADGLRILDAQSGAVLYTSQPRGDEASGVMFSPTNPDVYYFVGNGANATKLMQRTVSTQTTSTLRDFTTESSGAALQNYGGSQDFCDATGRYFLVRWGDATRVWDRVADVVYTNSCSDFATSGGWVGITPRGDYVVSAAGATAYPNKEHHSWAITHATRTVASSPVQWCGLGGDHSSLISCSNGNSYAVKFNSDDSPPGLYLWNLATDMTGLTGAQQVAAATKLVETSTYYDPDGHLCAVGKGRHQNWVYWACEYTPGDEFDSDPALDWAPYRQEIIAVNCVTLEVRRLAHHRSRDPSNYYSSPRIACSWGGEAVIWPSNFNDNGTANYADLYTIRGALPITNGPPPGRIQSHVRRVPQDGRN